MVTSEPRRTSALSLAKNVASYLRWWVRCVHSRTVVMVMVWGLGSLIMMPAAATRGWDALGALFVLFLLSAAVLTFPALRWRFQHRRQGGVDTGRHARQDPPWR